MTGTMLSTRVFTGESGNRSTSSIHVGRKASLSRVALHRFQLILWLGALGVVWGCSRSPGRTTITLATTTSVYDSGLLDTLLAVFEQRSKVDVKVVAVGSGQALELARRGDADVLIVHSPAAESLFMSQGYGESRKTFMRNQFILVGPRSDPAGTSRCRRITEALRRIAASQSTFVSRADDSGTHQKELSIWRQLGIEPGGKWYVRCGAGMAQTLRVASELQGYTLTDVGTFLTNKPRLSLEVLFAGDPLLENPYSVIVAKPRGERVEKRAEAARRLANFLFSPDARSVIANFDEPRTGAQLFEPVPPQ